MRSKVDNSRHFILRKIPRMDGVSSHFKTLQGSIEWMGYQANLWIPTERLKSKSKVAARVFHYQWKHTQAIENYNTGLFKHCSDVKFSFTIETRYT